MPLILKQQQSPQIKIKNLEIECLFLTKQLAEYLRKKLYRNAIQKVQKLFTSHLHQLHHLCASILLKILSLQTKALIKLLERNLYKKYTYNDHLAKKITRILNRNNFLSQAILIAKIQSKQILDDQNSGFCVHGSTFVCSVFKNDVDSETFEKLAVGFCENYLAAANLQIISFKNYQLQIDKWPNFSDILFTMSKNCPKFSFKVQFCTITSKMLLCRFLFQKGSLQQCLKLLNEVIQNLLNLHYKIRVWHQNIEGNEFISSNDKMEKGRKRKYYLRKLIRVLLIALILMVRANMKCGFESLAVEGINLFNFVFDKGDAELGHFRKYLNPEVYVFQQFYQYRAEKYEIQKIIEPLFLPELQDHLPSKHRELTDSDENQHMIEFYNQKMVEFHQKQQKKQKKLKLKRTANSHLLQKHKNAHPVNSPQPHSHKKTREANKSRQTTPTPISLLTQQSELLSQSNHHHRTSGHSLFSMQKLLHEELQKSNLAFLTQRQKHKEKLPINTSNTPDSIKRFNEHNDTPNFQDPSDTKRKSSMMNMKPLFEMLSNNFTDKDKQNHHLKLGTQLVSAILTKKVPPATNSSSFKPYFVKSSTENKPSSNKQNTPKQIVTKESGQRIMEMQHEMKKELKSHLELLKNKRNQKVINLFQASSNSTQQLIYQEKRSLLEREVSAQTFIAHKCHELEERGSFCSQPNVNDRSAFEPKTHKERLKMLDKKSKLQLFIDLLVKNKEYLGIKKWGQKIEYLKKKDELKQKVRQTRKTTSINCNIIQGLSPKMSFFAGNILKFSLQEIQEFAGNAGDMVVNGRHKSREVSNENNFKLGQKSIQILMNKLEREKQLMVKKEKQVATKREVVAKRENCAGNNNERTKSAHTWRGTEDKKTQGNSLGKYWYAGNTNSKSMWMCKFVL